MNKKYFIKSVFVLCLMAMPLRIVADDFLRGDVDQDGMVKISDITCLINYLLTGHWPEGNQEQVETEIYTVNGVSFTMVKVEGGTFTMGYTDMSSDDLANTYGYILNIEKPAHEVTLSSYSIGETEVTQALWQAVMGTNPSYFSPRKNYAENLQRPVECISWDDCQTFIAKLNELTGKTFRLPSEAEWEYAARGGNKSQGYMYSGSNFLDEVAWYFYCLPSQTEGSEGFSTQSVATKKANELGLYDMSGNVLEWCQDWYNAAYYNNSPTVNPSGPDSGYSRVTRGGCYANGTIYCRVSTRCGNASQYGVSDVGLRLAL